MATLNKETLYNEVIHAGEYGNGSKLLKTVSNVQPANTDVVHVARIPAYTNLLDLQLFNGAGGGSAAAKVGYLPVDDANGSGDDEFFIASADCAAAGRHRADSVKAPINLPYEVDIVVTANAAFASAVDLTIVLDYEWLGNA